MENRKSAKIYIVGAGISGLIAAKILEEKGYSPVLIEASSSVGGRLKTVDHGGVKIDVGFQVLLDAYPYAKKHLDYEKLALQKFKPGALIFKNGKKYKIGDPFRDITALFPTLFSPLFSFTDKLKILKLNRKLKHKSVEEIFSTKEQPTHQYLQTFGFSQTSINNFFQPFFAGIFLEEELATSSRMFEFVYKMFAQGSATQPVAGIQAIANQLKNQLKHTTIKCNTQVEIVREGSIILQNKETLQSDGTIIAAEVGNLIPNMRNQQTEWNSCENLYFECEQKNIPGPFIGLIANKQTLINNIVYVNPFHTTQKQPILLSVTIIKAHNLEKTELIKQVEKELKEECGIKNVKFIRDFKIKKALPQLNDLRYDTQPSSTQLMSTVFVAGDQLLNGSLNAAIISGERAAEGLLEKLEGNSMF